MRQGRRLPAELRPARTRAAGARSDARGTSGISGRALRGSLASPPCAGAGAASRSALLEQDFHGVSGLDRKLRVRNVPLPGGSGDSDGRAVVAEESDFLPQTPRVDETIVDFLNP